MYHFHSRGFLSSHMSHTHNTIHYIISCLGGKKKTSSNHNNNRTCHSTSTELNNPYFLCIPFIRSKTYITSWETSSYVNSSLIITLLTSSGQGLIAVYPPLPHNLHCLLSTSSYIHLPSTMSGSWALNWVKLKKWRSHKYTSLFIAR